ncbi:MAG: TIR domain-containing protein [Saprospiraceae bacterium]|nr:TIR domain-containing protein [Saprospiraceae bacterium]
MDDLLIFISYAEEDAPVKDAFIKEFSPAAQSNHWRLWQDGEIKPGAFWDNEIKANLEKAEVVVLLVSSDFLNSEYKNIVELKHALAKQQQGLALVIPVILDDCLWEDHDMLPKIQAVKANERIKEKGNKDEMKAALQWAARQVRDSVKTSQPAKSAAAGLKPEEINELRQLDPDALIIAVRQKQQRCLLLSKSGTVSQHPLSSRGLPQKVLSILQRLLLKGDLEEEDCRVLGEALFYRLFADPASQQAFVKAYKAQMPADVKPLKIVLHFDDQSSDLAGLPWEYLWLPLPEGQEEGFFIGEKENLVLSRRLSSVGKEKKVEADKLRILVAYSKPAVQEVAQRIDDDAQSVFGRSKPLKEEDKKLWANIEVSGPQEFKSQKDFEAFIKKEKPFHIVHFIGKGKTEKEVSHIAFCDAHAKKEEWLTPDEFVQCFPDGQKPNLIFLHAPPDSCSSLRDMALHLVTSVDGVLAIQTPVKSEEAADFSEKLYTALAKGEDLDEAVTHAARYTAAKSANRLRMYGISASFSRATLKLEVAKPAAAAATNEDSFVFWECPNHSDPLIQCKQLLPVKGGRCAWTFCKKCDAGPLWFCPNCQKAVANLSEKRCLNCGYETAQMVVPDEVRQLVPSAKTEGTPITKPTGPSTMTDRTTHSPQESRRAEPGLPR